MKEHKNTELPEVQHKPKAVFAPILTDFAHMSEVLRENEIEYEGELSKDDIAFCKMESQQECMYGTFLIPKLHNDNGEKYHMACFITKDKIILVDDEGFANKIINRCTRLNKNQFATKEKFLYCFITEFMNQDLALLLQTEKKLIEMEHEVLAGNVKEFNSSITMFRRKMLTLRSYYDEMAEVGKALEENENGYFRKGQLKYFGTIADRAERLANKTDHVLEFGKQVKDVYDSQIDARQNANMQFLTVLSAIFFPLTLITGWYGMNFENMPELAEGYPFIIIFSIVVVLFLVILFKIKKIL